GIDPWLENAAREADARGNRSAEVLHVLATAALCDREYARAHHLFEEAARKGDKDALTLAHLAADLEEDARF
ncbi:MAG TPA: hypothetical protein VER58_03355, partial [Thermoanaerobaculia bacterium]|nr:hypothetical protein [Thermoanaerobaculia bacterium]